MALLYPVYHVLGKSNMVAVESLVLSAQDYNHEDIALFWIFPNLETVLLFV